MHRAIGKFTLISPTCLGWQAGALVLLCMALPVRAQLTLVNIYNNVRYNQTTTVAPTTIFGAFFEMGCSVQTAGDFNSASVTYPGPSMQSLPAVGTGFSYQTTYYPSVSALHGAYPFGTYTFTATNSVTMSSQTGVINYSADYFTSSIPAFAPASYTSLQSYKPSTALTVNFNSYTANPGDNDPLTFFTIYNPSNEQAIFTSGGLPNTATSATIPAGTLEPGTEYTAELDFTDRLLGTDTVNDVPTLQGSDVRTDVSFITATPEPASCGILATGMCLLLRRRSRR